MTEGAEAIATERRVQVHLGTRATPARVVDLGGCGVQLRLERVLLAGRGDRIVVRRIAPPYTLGGGVVRDPSPSRHGRDWAGPLAATTNRQAGPVVLPSRWGQGWRAEPSPLARRLLAELEAGGDRPPGAGELAERLAVGRREVDRSLAELVAVGAAVRLKADLLYPTPTYERLRKLVVALAIECGSTSIAEIRDALGLSRKYAQALLEALDAERVLRRDGDRHYPRRGPSSDAAAPDTKG